MRRRTSSRKFLPVLVLSLLTTGCAAVQWVGIQMYYEPAELTDGRVLRDLPYREDADADHQKHRLNLFLPRGSEPEADAAAPWPTVIFVHGGGWDTGDKDLRVGGADVYGNIGRFFADRGFGVAVINYRLQPKVTWREQVQDVAAATAWVHHSIEEYGGSGDRIFLTGHSAGAQLATFVVLKARLLEEQGISTAPLCGVIPVSGAGYDLVDEETYRLGASRSYNASRFKAEDPDGVWEREASALTYISEDGAGVPPFLLPYSLREWPGLQHQNRLLHKELQQRGIDSRLLPTQGQSHARMVLQLSDPQSLVSRAVLEFFESVSCPRP